MQMFSLLFPQWQKTCMKCNMSGGYLHFAVLLLLLFVFGVCVCLHTQQNAQLRIYLNPVIYLGMI